jgi:hypothetical protein
MRPTETLPQSRRRPRQAHTVAAGALPHRPAAGEPQQPTIDRFLAQHLALAQGRIETEFGPASVTVDESEIPLVWLARRRGRNGRPLIETHQLQAGERLRVEFTHAHLMPCTTSNWASPIASGRRDAAKRVADITDTMIAARQSVNNAIEAVGPEFGGLLLDVCCFLKRLDDIERERAWPERSAKVVLQLALDRLARHYGISSVARGRDRVPIRTWLAQDAAFSVDGKSA